MVKLLHGRRTFHQLTRCRLHPRARPRLLDCWVWRRSRRGKPQMATPVSAVQSRGSTAAIVRAASASNVTGETESRALHIRGFQ